MTQPNMKTDILKSYIQEQYEGLGGSPEEYPTDTNRRVREFYTELQKKREYSKFTTFESDLDEMVVLNRLRLFSFCEHHLMPFHGEAAIGYIPNGKIFGLSKVQRIVDKFASRPQLQEKLTSEILDYINYLIGPKGAAVRIKATHTCITSRGTQSTNAEVVTMRVSGVLKENAQARNEFLENIK